MQGLLNSSGNNAWDVLEFQNCGLQLRFKRSEPHNEVPRWARSMALKGPPLRSPLYGLLFLGHTHSYPKSGQSLPFLNVNEKEIIIFWLCNFV